MIGVNIFSVNYKKYFGLLMNQQEIQELDLRYNWHPCSQMKDYERFKPLVVKSAFDSYIELSDGRIIIDAISSWWCKSLGHNHPILKKALVNQLKKFEHVIFANTTYQTIVKLSQELSNFIPGLDKVFYAGDGSSAVEIAMKMSLHFRVLQNKSQKNKFIALKNGYHGETTGALSVSDLGLYRSPYAAILFNPILITPLYVSGTNDPYWNNADQSWPEVEKKLEKHKRVTAAIIFEPILQGAAGMKLYSRDFLVKLAAFAKANDIHLIADEIMTGIGRTGKMLACEHAGIKPDFVCLSKGLTSGWLPFSAVLTTQEIYQAFYDDFEEGKSFLHSNTYTGNALGASIALATLDVIKKENLLDRANILQITMRQNMQQIADTTGVLENIRGIGAVVAADLVEKKYLPKRLGFTLYQEAIKLGALLRPLGNTIYWSPPLTVSQKTLESLREITQQAILNVYKAYYFSQT